MFEFLISIAIMSWCLVNIFDYIQDERIASLKKENEALQAKLNAQQGVNPTPQSES